MHYFGYGSNMDESDLKKWCESNKRPCPEWTLLGTACLEDYKLSFNYLSRSRNGGAANLMELPGQKVYGLLFEMNENDDLTTMRKKEGYPGHYEEILVTVECDGEHIGNVTTYKVVEAKEKPGHQRPTAYYMDLILRSARKYRFPAEYIQFLEGVETQ